MHQPLSHSPAAPRARIQSTVTTPEQPAASLHAPPRLILASRSPRRRRLLAQAGFAHESLPPPVNDADLARPPALPSAHWVAALAYFKAAATALTLPDRSPALVLGADTVCVHGDAILGQPRDAQHAAAMIRAMQSATHDVLTGVAVLDLAAGTRLIFTDRAVVRVGEIGEDRILEYVRSDLWHGKAGAYNLEERIAAGWPIHCLGDPATVMGLPMRMLTPILSRRLVRPATPTQEVSP